MASDQIECRECAEREEQGFEEPCAACRRKIHEGWHVEGWWWIRAEECHPDCPGRKREVAEASHA